MVPLTASDAIVDEGLDIIARPTLEMLLKQRLTA
jgi:hypothetical protein